MGARTEYITLDGVEYKQCTCCREYKQLSRFHKKSKYVDGAIQYRSHCIECANKKNLVHYHKNRKGTLAHATNAYRYTLKTAYGLSQEAFEGMLEGQQNRCLICGVLVMNPFNPTVGGEKQAVDHCHTTGKIRGILCTTCNSGIGLLKDSKDILQKALTYLEKYG
jgi:hypothetical protein